MTYVRRDRKALQISTDPNFPPHPDAMAIIVVGLRPRPLRVFNVYNAGTGSERTGESVRRLLARGAPASAELYAGDFNLHHPDWSIRRVTNRGELANL